MGANCGGADWRAIGFVEGSRGAVSPLAHYERNACAPAAGAGAYALYLAGWRDGVDGYCEPANGFRLGAGGEDFNGVCNGPEAAAFTEAFRAGEALYEAETTTLAARNAYSNAQRELWVLKHRIAVIEVALRSPSTSLTERREMLAEERVLAEDAAALEAVLERLSAEIASAQTAAAELRARHAARFPSGQGAAARPQAASY